MWPADRRLRIAIAAGITVVLVVVGIGLSYIQPVNAVPPSSGTPTVVFVLMPNGSAPSIPAGGNLALGPFNLTALSWWTPSGSWWESNGTSTCLTSKSGFATWNASNLSGDCNGFAVLGSPNIGGGLSIPGGWGVPAGVYHLVWYNLGPTYAVSIRVTSPVELTASESSCNLNPVPSSC